MQMLRKITRKFNLFLINHFLSGTRFFALKRGLLRLAGYKVGDGTRVVGPIKVTASLEIGRNCFIGTGFHVHGNGKVVIGDNCDLAPEIVVLTGSHEIGDSSHRAGKGYNGTVIIGNGCWIGGCSRILPDVNIGCGVVIAACSVVNKDIPENTMAAGVPCKVKRDLEGGDTL